MNNKTKQKQNIATNQINNKTKQKQSIATNQINNKIKLIKIQITKTTRKEEKEN
jgi:hypothetical protein